MKKLHSFVFYALLAPALTLSAGSVLAQDSAGQDMDREKDAKQSTPENAQRANQSDPLVAADRRNTSDKSHMQNKGYMNSPPVNGMQASNLIDAEVKTTGDEDIGQVNDLIIDKDGQVVAIVVGVGGFLGMGEKDVAIGWDDVTRSGTADKQELRIAATREALRAAPKFEAEKSTSSSTTASSKTASSMTAQSDQNSRRARQPDAQMTADRQNTSDKKFGDDNKFGTQNRGYLSSAPKDGLQASNLLDAEVKTTGDEDIGQVSDLLIDKDGQVVAIVVGVGGFLGMGEKDVAIGWDDVTRSGTADKQELRIVATREALRAAPKFEAEKSTSSSTTAQNDQSSRRARQSDAQMTAGRQNTSDSKFGDDKKYGEDKKYGTQNRGYMSSAPANGIHASNLIGAEIKTTGDEDVGPVNDLIIDDKGQVVAVVVGVGGFLGMGERDVAIGWDDVTRSGTPDDLELRIDSTREALQAAPEFETRD